MKKYGKKHLKSVSNVEKGRLYSFEDAFQKIKESARAKFDETVDANVVLGIDPENGEHVVRGSLLLPNQFKKVVRVIAFAKGEQAEDARAAGADFVGTDDLVEKIISGWMDFDFAVATPDLMGLVGKVAKILGPRGLLPNKKNNTVALNISPIIKELKMGLSFFKNDKYAQVNFSFGKVSFDSERLVQNLNLFLNVLRASRPSTAKGVFIKSVSVSSTMGPGVRLDVNSFNG
jgi:large subunit ribosomal protein L1